MLDMGPYYLTALVNLLGPVARVTGSARITFPTRVVGSGPKEGEQITVKTPTHLAGVMDFVNGAVATVVMSFDVWGSEVPCIEVYGTKGTMSVPNPNGFGGAVRVKCAGEKEWRELEAMKGPEGGGRGIGVADMSRAIRDDGKVRASGEMAFHVLEVMEAFEKASQGGKHVRVKSSCERPEAIG